MPGGAIRLKLEVKTNHKGCSWHVVKATVIAGNFHAVRIGRVKNVVYGQIYLAFFKMHVVIAEGVVDPCVKNIGSCLAERSFPEHFEDEFVDILVSVVKPEFAFFQMKVKSVFCQPSKSYKARLGEGPEAFNAINM